MAPPVSDNGTQDAVETEAEADPLPALPMQKDSDPEWAKTETPAEPAEATDPKQAVPMQKPAPKWAQTVPAPPGEPVSETELPATTSKRTWPPAGGPQTAPEGPTERPTGAPLEDVAPLQGAIPEETDVWPPEPPTEHTMPAWPPSSMFSKGISDSSPAATSEPISSWPDSFDSVLEVTRPPAMTEPPAPAVPPAATVPAAATTPPASTVSRPVTTPPAPIVPSATTAPPAPPAPTVPPAVVVAPIAPTVPPAAAAPIAAVEPIAPTVPPPRPAAAPAPPAPAPSTPPASAPPAQVAPVQQSGDSAIDWPDAVPIPSWAPQIHVTSEHRVTSQPAAQAAPAPPTAQVQQPQPPAPPVASQPPPAPPFAVPASVAPQPGSSPGAQKPAGTASRSSWEVVEQKRKVDPKKVVPTPEDRSYAEWFAWAKRGGAPAGACHAAAQGAFQALSSGKDVATAVQWATAAMTRPPVPVSADRQSYCAWFSLANIDLNFDQHRAHAFATAAVHALDAGADAASAHAAGLHAAGIK